MRSDFNYIIFISFRYIIRDSNRSITVLLAKRWYYLRLCFMCGCTSYNQSLSPAVIEPQPAIMPLWLSKLPATAAYLSSGRHSGLMKAGSDRVCVNWFGIGVFTKAGMAWAFELNALPYSSWWSSSAGLGQYHWHTSACRTWNGPQSIRSQSPALRCTC